MHRVHEEVLHYLLRVGDVDSFKTTYPKGLPFEAAAILLERTAVPGSVSVVSYSKSSL